MVPRNRGAIINVASVAGFARSQGSVSYCATKSWMNIFSEGLYLELRGMGSKVMVQTLCPGFTYSEFHDTMAINREKLAGKALWLTAEQVVEASLRGLQEGRLYVIPGWRYRLLTAIISKLPSSLRLAMEQARGNARIVQEAKQ
jgi:short-subunit dehydrogenase